MGVRGGGLETGFDDVERAAEEDAGGARDVAVGRIRLGKMAGFALWGHTQL
jgi:hypothetical protein